MIWDLYAHVYYRSHVRGGCQYLRWYSRHTHSTLRQLHTVTQSDYLWGCVDFVLALCWLVRVDSRVVWVFFGDD